MKLNSKYWRYSFVVILFATQVAVAQINPAEKYPDLFEAVQLEEIFQDQKRFVDCPGKVAPDSVKRAYAELKDQSHFNLKDFVGHYFDTLQHDTTAMLKHIHYLWNDLTKQPKSHKQYSSLITLPHAYIVPGGRFKEIYYWDSYFTMLGLQEDNQVEMIQNMVDNFEYLILNYGHVPNGNRTYYLSRSQPPFFALMVQLLAETLSDETILVHYLPALEKEYTYWMTGKKVVKVEGGQLNRYWDELNTPRPESYKHDVVLFEEAGRDSSMYRDIRSAAESGWDFSTRWFEDGKHMKTIVTTSFLPIDLNCLLYKLEMTISQAYELNMELRKANDYAERAENRKNLILKYCWDEQANFFVDYNIETTSFSKQHTLAGMFPLYFNLATKKQAELVKDKIEANFLKPGGVVTTLVEGAGQQWDYPNAWAPLQWVVYRGLQKYGYNDLAKQIAKRWINLNIKVYFETGKMMEKYDVVNINRPGGGGEYETQDGFGWTNGVFLKLWSETKK
jgi:alpha,alpha-trehalase